MPSKLSMSVEYLDYERNNSEQYVAGNSWDFTSIPSPRGLERSITFPPRFDGRYLFKARLESPGCPSMIQESEYESTIIAD